MAKATVISQSFEVGKTSDGKPILSPRTLILAKGRARSSDGKEVDAEIRVSVPVTRGEVPQKGAEIEITEAVEQVKPRFNDNGVPIRPNIVYSANLLSKTTPALVKRENAAPAKSAAK